MAEANETITVRRHKVSYLEMYEITADELDRFQFEEPQKSHQLSFALASLSFAVAFGISLLTQAQQMSDRTFAVFVALTVVAVLFFLFCILSWSSNLKQRNLLFKRVRERQVGPVGEEGTELQPDELAKLPSEDATGSSNLSASIGPKRTGAVDLPGVEHRK